MMNRYVLDLQHGSFKWTVKKRFEDFLVLHSTLHVYRTLLSIQLPEIKFQRKYSRRRTSIVLQTAKVPKLHSFPLTSDVLLRKKNIDLSKIALESYLQTVLDTPKFRKFRDTYCVSPQIRPQDTTITNECYQEDLFRLHCKVICKQFSIHCSVRLLAFPQIENIPERSRAKVKEDTMRNVAD
ncbi:PX domain-containing protein [Nephila pilipes]|uniref:PX domain-containing protein n=1 Tax=Nephila pilipes TaxID=299642 RepID=A0A8X6NI29_NEPPI|nr:PX domain-containing protein [Nephila pilipes]